jgi:hypothetical protein
MGWYKQACAQCWDNHDGRTCEEFQRDQAHWQSVRESERLMREQTELLKGIAMGKKKGGGKKKC